MTDQDKKTNEPQDKKMSVEEAIERIKEIDSRETPPVKKEKAAPIIWAVIIILMLLAFFSFYRLAPGFFVNRGIPGSGIIYTSVTETSPGSGYSTRYTIDSGWRTISLKIEFFNDYIGDFSNEEKPGKVVEGKLSSDKYAELFESLWKLAHEMEKDVCSPIGGTLEMKKRKEKIEVCILSEMQDEIDRKFKALTTGFTGKTDRTYLDENPEIQLLAENTEPGTALEYSLDRNALIFNNSRGEMTLFHLDSNHDSIIGQNKLVSANRQGLVMILEIEKEGALVLWEKRMLHNVRKTLAKKWETNPKFRQVHVSDSSVYYMIPRENGSDHSLMKFDYIDYKFTTLIESTSSYLEDMTPDGEYVLLRNPHDRNLLTVVKGTGENPEVKSITIPGEVEQVSGFFRNYNEFVILQEGSIKTWSPGKDSKILVKEENKGKNFPVTFNHDRTRLLYREEQTGIYHVLDLSDSSSRQVNKTPMTISRPVFTGKDDTLYFARFDDLLRWEPKRTEQKGFSQ
jgi:hypothetical protein